MPSVTDLRLDVDALVADLVRLLDVPSPTGFTDAATDEVASAVHALGLPTRRTPKGALLWTIPGGDGPPRSVASHIDTLGAMVKEIKPSGRLKLSPLGGYDWATVEGAECRLTTFEGRAFTGTVVNVKQSTHVHGPKLRDLKRDQDAMELRLDAEAWNDDDVRALGVGVGDPVAFLARPSVTPSGFVKGRHLDNKASVAACLAVTRTVAASGVRPPGDVHVFVSNYEEVGHGAAAGIPADTEELLCLDMAAVGEGQRSREDAVTLCVKDATGPYDAGMNRALRRLAARADLPLEVDIYPYYGSDASAAWRAGGRWRAALIGPGVDASHAFERTHRKALDATARLLLAWMLAPAVGAAEARPASPASHVG
ncbi:MAG: M42 family metallopeptidase [Trueperaceae bacterium]|nr:M42 family metallopeptidase [Trueperaceae bacterium]